MMGDQIIYNVEINMIFTSKTDRGVYLGGILKAFVHNKQGHTHDAQGHPAFHFWNPFTKRVFRTRFENAF